MAIKTYRVLRERQANLLNATIQRLKLPLLAGGGVLSADAHGNIYNSASDPGAPSIETAWGGIAGTLSNQTDLQNALNTKLEASDIASKVDDTTTVNSQPLSSDVTLDADDISDVSTTNKFVTDAEKSTWNNKLDSVPNNTDAAKIANGTVNNTEFQYLNGVTSAIQTQLNSKAKKINRTTQSNLTCDFATYNYIVASIGTNSSFSLSNVPTDEIVTVLIKNTSGSTITITMPNTADMWSAATYDIDGNGAIEFSIMYDGTTRNWQVSEVLL